MFVLGFCKFVLNIYCHIVYKIKLIGKENVPEGPAILCANHVNFFDSISLIIFFKRLIRPMAKEELFKGKFMNWFMRQLGAFPVKRGKGDVEAIETAMDVLKNGELLLIFPEGTRNALEEGKKFKKGAALIALMANVPVVPIGIKGNYKLFSKIRINIGKPITLEKYKTGKDYNPREVVELTNVIQNEVVRLRDEE